MIICYGGPRCFILVLQMKMKFREIQSPLNTYYMAEPGFKLKHPDSNPCSFFYILLLHRNLWLQAWLCHQLAVWPWEIHIISFGLISPCVKQSYRDGWFLRSFFLYSILQSNCPPMAPILLASSEWGSRTQGNICLWLH